MAGVQKDCLDRVPTDGFTGLDVSAFLQQYLLGSDSLSD